jgi:hypothetical protein
MEDIQELLLRRGVDLVVSIWPCCPAGLSLLLPRSSPPGLFSGLFAAAVGGICMGDCIPLVTSRVFDGMGCVFDEASPGFRVLVECGNCGGVFSPPFAAGGSGDGVAARRRSIS